MPQSASLFSIIHSCGIIAYALLFLGIIAFLMGVMSVLRNNENEYRMKVLPYLGIFIFMFGVLGFGYTSIQMHNMIASTGGQMKPDDFSFIQIKIHIPLFLGSFFGCLTYILYMIALRRTESRKKADAQNNN